jgi:hypothetical protein
MFFCLKKFFSVVGRALPAFFKIRILSMAGCAHPTKPRETATGGYHDKNAFKIKHPNRLEEAK